jgi:hypothetical protein
MRVVLRDIRTGAGALLTSRTSEFADTSSAVQR